MNRAVLVAAALVLAPLALSSQEVPPAKDQPPPSASRSTERATPSERIGELSRSAFRDRVAQSIEAVEDACAADIDDFCGRVTVGGGRVASCMLAHEDQLSSGCQSALYRAAREFKRNVDRVAEACWNELQALCGEAGKVAQCVEQKKGSLSSSCQTIVGALGQRVHALMALVGMPVYSSDNKTLGQVVVVTKGPDDTVQSIQVDIGRILGLGTKMVTITADKLERRLPGVRVLLSETEVRSLPEAKKQ